MAHNKQQERYMARELARAGGNVALAVQALKSDYESMRTVGQTTLLRFQKKPYATQWIAEEFELIRAASIDAAIKVERERAETDMRGSEKAHIAQVESLIATIYDKLSAWAKNPDADDAGKYMDLYARLLAIHDKRLVKVLPCISDEGELQCVLLNVGLELQAELGTRAADFMRGLQEKIGEALRQRRNALNAQSPH